MMIYYNHHHNRKWGCLYTRTRKSTHTYARTYTHTHTHTPMYIYKHSHTPTDICVCTCLVWSKYHHAFKFIILCYIAVRHLYYGIRSLPHNVLYINFTKCINYPWGNCPYNLHCTPNISFTQLKGGITHHSTGLSHNEMSHNLFRPINYFFGDT